LLKNDYSAIIRVTPRAHF